MHIEVLTPLVDNESGKSLGKKWLPGEVVCISDGNQTVTEWGRKKRKVRGRNPVGWSCVQFYDGEEDWYKLEGASFNNSAQRSWRLDLDFGCDGMGDGASGSNCDKGSSDTGDSDGGGDSSAKGGKGKQKRTRVS